MTTSDELGALLALVPKLRCPIGHSGAFSVTWTERTFAHVLQNGEYEDYDDPFIIQVGGVRTGDHHNDYQLHCRDCADVGVETIFDIPKEYELQWD